MKQNRKPKGRNPFVLQMSKRTSGAHQKSDKTLRRAKKQALRTAMKKGFADYSRTGLLILQ